MLRGKLISQLGSPDYRAQLITNFQSTSDIVEAIKKQHVANRAEAKKICKYFDKGNERDTARAIFNFLKSETSYEREPNNKQTTKTIKRFLADAKGDCKHYSLFINNILEACGYSSPVYRFAGYSRNGYTHVYSYLPKTNTVVDAVLSSFDTEKKPTIKKDMSLYSLSGIDTDTNTDEINGVNFSKITNNLKKATAKTSDVVKKAVKEIPKATEKLAQGTKTISLAPARVSFIGLVKLNGLSLASNLKTLYDKQGRAGLDFWEKLGGNRDELIKAFTEGSKKKALLSGIEEESASRNEIFEGYDADGVDTMGAVGIAAAVASATPILLQVKNILDKLGIKPEQAQLLASSVKKGAEGFQNLTGKKVTDVIFKKDSGTDSTSKATYTSKDLQPTNYTDAKKVVEGSIAKATGTDIQTVRDIANVPDSPVTPEPKKGMLPIELPKLNQKVILIGASVLALFFILRKKA